MSRILPILFNTDMVRAILDGRKNVTRRILKLPKHIQKQDDGLYTLFAEGTCYEGQRMEDIMGYLIPPYKEGTFLYVRETYCPNYFDSITQDGNRHGYKADYDSTILSSDIAEPRWTPSIHMPKEAARIWLKVTNVRVEQLQDMTLNDFLSEGIVVRPEAFNDPENAYQQAKSMFINIWDSTIKEADRICYGWDASPWVWVIEFERCEKQEGEK